MKRRILVALGLALALEARAGELRLGAWGGANVSALEIERLQPEPDGRTAGALGAVLAFRPGSRWSLELRPSCVGRGASVLVAGSAVEVRASVLELPILVTVDLGQSRLRPYVLAGAALSHVSKATAVSGATEQDIVDDFARTDTTLRVGAGLAWRGASAQPFVEVEYTHGLSDLNGGTGLGRAVGAIRNRGVQVRGGISFRVK